MTKDLLNLTKKLTFDVSQFQPEDFLPPEEDLYITFYEEDGCVCDYDEISYEIDTPDGLICQMDGYWIYSGELTEEVITEYFLAIGFKYDN